jgi:hypothetical protein
MLDTSVAHQARIYDYWLGGKDNFAVDREAGDRALELHPNIIHGVRANRAFLVRAVRYLAEEIGIRQYLDVGTGLPSANNTHEVAQKIAPESRIVYVDNDPVVLLHARALLTSRPEGACAYLDADARVPESILTEAAQILDLSQPVALMMLGLLQLIRDGVSGRRDADGRVAFRQLPGHLPSGGRHEPRRQARRSPARHAVGGKAGDAVPRRGRQVLRRPGDDRTRPGAGCEVAPRVADGGGRARLALGGRRPQAVTGYAASSGVTLTRLLASPPA